MLRESSSEVAVSQRKKKGTRKKRRFGCLKLGCGCTTLSLALGAATGLLAAVGVGGSYYYYVVANPGPHLARENIEAVISQDSPVYYRDGTTRLGVFFEDEHRESLAFEELPPAWVAAIVAAEDGGYWSHHGVSPKHIARAMVSNIKAGSVVSGGSTLTQQTAKNIFYRPDRSLKSKGTELLNALRLEAHYDKTEILTFYANQFHVTGNGRGLGIAARYFFDVEVSELTVLEAAFLAGLVKAPTYYDPFRGDAEQQERNRGRAHDRVGYVLRRLAEEDPERLAGPVLDLAEVEAIQVEAARLLEDGYELPFSRGTFRYDSNAILDEVSRRLAEPPFDAVLAVAGVEDPESAGLAVVTTLDPNAQREATYGLWHHLSEVGPIMEALTAEDFVREAAPPRPGARAPAAHEFRLARVSAHLGSGSSTHLELDLGGHACVVDRDGVTRAATAVHRGQRQSRSANPRRSEVTAFAEALADDAVVWVSVREVPADGPALCDLEIRPELQGSLVAIEDGQIRAMVAGNDNRNFNRAEAMRQLGSTWKPLVYHAAIDLGWSPADGLWNERAAFPFGGSWYYPSPDHEPEPTVSMAWAGVRSENVASVWLLFHLTDHLSALQVGHLAETLDLARRPSEDDAAYRERLRSLGVHASRSRTEEADFLRARRRVAVSVEGTDHHADALYLTHLLYGRGVDTERDRLRRSRESGWGWKSAALDHTWLALAQRAEVCEAQYDALHATWEDGQLPPARDIDQLRARWDEEAGELTVACGVPVDLPEGEEEAWVRVDAELLALLRGVDVPEEPEAEPDEPEVEEDTGVPAAEESTRRRRRWWQRRHRDVESSGSGRAHPVTQALTEATAVRLPPLPLPGELWIDGRIHLRTVDRLADRIESVRARRVREGWGSYDPEVLYWTQEFRLLLGIRYVAELGRRYGIRSDIAEVLSMPLGATEITLEEAAMVYGGLVTGAAWTFPGHVTPRRGGMEAEVESPPAPGLLIAEIRDIDGHVLYRATPERRQVASPVVGAQTADILRNIVMHGTGRRAEGAVSQGGARVPLGGKTGTTNEFRNAAWLGYAPRAGSQYDPTTGWIVGVYVGYDDNRPMRAGRAALAGASGALPAWVIAVRGFYEHGLLGEPGARGRGTWPLAEPEGVVRWAVEGGRGMPILSEDGRPVEATQAAGLTVLVAEAEADAVMARLEEAERVDRPAATRDPRRGGLWRRSE